MKGTKMEHKPHPPVSTPLLTGSWMTVEPQNLNSAAATSPSGDTQFMRAHAPPKVTTPLPQFTDVLPKERLSGIIARFGLPRVTCVGVRAWLIRAPQHVCNPGKAKLAGADQESTFAWSTLNFALSAHTGGFPRPARSWKHVQLASQHLQRCRSVPAGAPRRGAVSLHRGFAPTGGPPQPRGSGSARPC